MILVEINCIILDDIKEEKKSKNGLILFDTKDMYTIYVV